MCHLSFMGVKELMPVRGVLKIFDRFSISVLEFRVCGCCKNTILNLLVL